MEQHWVLRVVAGTLWLKASEFRVVGWRQGLRVQRLTAWLAESKY